MDISYIEKHPNRVCDDLYNPKAAHNQACKVFEKFSLDDSTRIIKEAIEELCKVLNGKFYGSWYTVFEPLKDNKVKKFSLFQISKTVNEYLNKKACFDDWILFLYHQLYNNMSQYTHGSSFGDRIATDDNGEFYCPRDYPKNGVLMVVFIQTMFSEILMLISDRYFFGKNDEWNSIDKLQITKFHDKQKRLKDKLRELDLQLP